MVEIVNFLNANSGISIFVSSVAALISAIAVGVALYFNSKTQNQYKKSLEPQISMRIDKFGGMLYLLIQNLGRTAAQNIKLSVMSIENNGDNGLELDSLLSQSFELYPNETVQALVAISGENVATGFLYPKITVAISYRIYGTKKTIQYTRTVIFSKVYDLKVLADVNMDLHKVESALTATARASIRTANYLDGHKIAIFDELDMLTDISLKNDICSVIESTKKGIVKDRTATIEECQIGKRKPRTKKNNQ